MLKALQRILLFLLLLASGLFLAYQGFLYYRARDRLPTAATIAGIDVGEMTREEAIAKLNDHYFAPVFVYHRDERVEIAPAEVGFTLDTEGMLAEVEGARETRPLWQGFLEFVAGRSLEPVRVSLRATHDPVLLQERLVTIAEFLDNPPIRPQLTGDTASFAEGRAGYVTDIEASLPAVAAALYRAGDRRAELVVVDESAPALDMILLEQYVEELLASFDGVGSIFVLDLQTGEEMSINGDVAMSGLSIVKIPILLETYRALTQEPNSDQWKLINETAVFSGNFSANLLLDVVAGQDNAYLGVDILTLSMQRLGLNNTYIVTPYEEPNRQGKSTMSTPANSRSDIDTNPDLTMQTTANDMGTLLSMIYYCAQGEGGALQAVYPGQLTQEECQAVLEVLSLNEEGNLIRYGVPPGTVVAHKHGWAGNTHGDAGVVFSPGGDYVLVEYLAQPHTDWLVYEASFPLLREISRAVYNYFNHTEPYGGVEESDLEVEATGLVTQ